MTRAKLQIADVETVSFQIELKSLLKSNLSSDTKHEIIEWLWASNQITDQQYSDFDGIAWTWIND